MAICAALGLTAAGCGGGGGGHGHAAPAKPSVRLSITPADSSTDSAPDKGITVTAVGGKLTKIVARSGGAEVAGRFNAARTAWHSRWALDVSQSYTVTATGAGRSGGPVTRTS